MPSTKRSRVALIALFLAAAGCTNTDATSSGRGAHGAVSATHGARLEASRDREYRSVAELKADAVAVVIADATSNAKVSTVGTVPFTTTEMAIREILRGSLPSRQSLQLRQLGSSDQQEENAPLVVSGKQYLIFVTPFVYSSGDYTGEYVVIGGGAGLFETDGQDSFRKLDGLSPKLPAHLHRSDSR